jgi:toxin HigB-1
MNFFSIKNQPAVLCAPLGLNPFAKITTPLDVHRAAWYLPMLVIKSFRRADTKRVFDDLPSKPFQAVHSVARRKLLTLNAASSLNDLSAVPGNRLEPLKGARAGQHSIRVNDQYRVCFVWRESDAHDVEITKHYE